MLVVTRAGAEDVSEFIVLPAEPGRRLGTFEAAHWSVAAFETPVILFQPVIEVAAGPVPHPFAELGPDRAGVAVVAVGRDPVGRHPSDCPGRAEERLRRRHVAVLAEQHVHERASAVDRAIEIAPAPTNLQICLINVPAAAHLAAPAVPQLLGQRGGELGLPRAHGLSWQNTMPRTRNISGRSRKLSL